MTALGGGPRRATAADGPDVVDILVGAFLDDPTWSWAFPDGSLRAGQLRQVWRLLVAGALRYPWVWLAPGNSATAVWIPPDGTDLSEEQAAELAVLVADLLGADAPRVMHLFELFEDARPSAPHYYLTLLGTSVEQRGHGYGLGLLAENLREVDRVAMPAYLEASNPVNVALYERYGFAVRESFTLPGGGPEVFTMWRA